MVVGGCCGISCCLPVRAPRVLAILVISGKVTNLPR